MLKRLLPFLVPACLFALVLGIKLDVIHRYGSDLPRWDQLDVEGLATFVPLAEGRLGPADIFRPHNEHRVVWTKLLGLAELKLNGQWDARLQCAVNATLHSAIAVLVFLFSCRGTDRKIHAPLFVLIALLFGLPLAWENPLAGFHSQQYFLLGFSFGAIVLLPFAAAWSARWWAGAICTLAALFTMGSGLFAAAIVLGLVAAQGWIARDWAGALRRNLPTVSLCVITLILGALGRVSVNYHDALKAGSVGDFLLYALHCLQWPAREWSVLALVIWLPFAILTSRILRRHDDAAKPFPLALLGLGAWVLLQILATAYTRGVNGGMPSSRYGDTLAFGLIVNGVALAWLWPRFASPRISAALALAWILATALPGYSYASFLFGEILPEARRHLAACEENVRRYLVTDDATHLDSADIPYPGIAALRERLDPPAIRAILPVSVRPPLSLASPARAGSFAPHRTIRRARTHIPPPVDLPAPFSALPKLEQRAIWFSDREGEFTHPLEFPRATVLRFLVAGAGRPELSLTSPSSKIVPVGLDRLSAAAWRSVHVHVPPGRFVLQARVTDGSWLAFSEPVEMGVGSYWTWRLMRTGHLLWPSAAAAAVLCGVGAWYCARREKALGWPGRSGGTPA